MISQMDKLTDARRPRSMVKITWWKSGAKVTEEVKGWVEWEVDNNAFYQADTFHITFAQSGLPPGYDLNWWSSQQQIWVEILAGFPKNPERTDASELTTWMLGMADEISYDPVARMIDVSGRDLSALMVDSKTTLKWQNLTSSDIVTQIAQGHDLKTQTPDGKPTVKTTTTMAGKYCGNDHASMTDEQSEWDLLCWLAQHEGFVVYLRGPAIYFQPKPDPATATPYLLSWQSSDQQASPKAGVESISFSRNLTLSRDVAVEVQSWTMDEPTKPFKQTATAKHTAGAPPGAPQTYSYAIPNLTQDKALKKAQALLQELTAHEVKMSVSMPADNVMDVGTLLQVSGTRSSYDQIYYPDSVVRRMSLEEGYTMRISAKNSSPLSMVTS